MQSQIGLLRTAATLALLTAALHGEVKVLKNCTLIDGSGRPPLKDAALIVDNGRIQWVGPSTQLKTPASESARQPVPLGRSFSRKPGARVSARAARRDTGA